MADADLSDHRMGRFVETPELLSYRAGRELTSRPDSLEVDLALLE
jgi:hypothetical protein